MEVHHEMDHFNIPSTNIAHESSIPNISHVLGFKDDLNWDSDASIWAMGKDTENAEVTDHPKPSKRKHKKQSHNSEIQSYGIMVLRLGSLRSRLRNSSQGPSRRAWIQPHRLHPLDCHALILGFKCIDRSTWFTTKLS
jgi:hypothetical protein